MDSIDNGKIYKITNKLNGKNYVGQTARSVNSRMIEHLSIARGEPSQRFALHDALAKYGREFFKVGVIEDGIDSLEELHEKEIYYIDKYKSYKDGYNLTIGGKTRYGSGIPVVQLDKNTGKLIQEFASSAVAGRTTGFNIDNISKAVREEGCTANGFVWVRSSDFHSEDFKFDKHNYISGSPIVQLNQKNRGVYCIV